MVITIGHRTTSVGALKFLHSADVHWGLRSSARGCPSWARLLSDRRALSWLAVAGRNNAIGGRETLTNRFPEIQ
jgi:hypothetical protein